MATGTKGNSVFLISGLLLILIAGPVIAGTIVDSKHDFHFGNIGNNPPGDPPTPFAGVWEVPGPGGFPSAIDEICVFCHTPHGASKNIPGLSTPTWLWNRTNPTGLTYQMYSSSTFSGAATASTSPTGVSLMCMSCHDGVTSIAVNTLLNAPGSGNPTVSPNGIPAPGAMGNVYNGGAFLGWGPNLGEQIPGGTTINLSNDHPISFDWPTNVPGLRTSPTDTRLRLFGVGKNRVECATCHSVHDPTTVPFLAMPNTNSDMCRACHDK